MEQNNVPVFVTDIVPGWVATEGCSQDFIKRHYWVTSLEKAGEQILDAIKSKSETAYISGRWRIASLAINWSPE